MPGKAETRNERVAIEVLSHAYGYAELVEFCGHVSRAIDIKCHALQNNAGFPGNVVSLELANAYNANVDINCEFLKVVKDIKKRKEYQRRFARYVIKALKRKQTVVNWKVFERGFEKYIEQNY